MNIDWATFFAMGGRGFYVWGAFGVTFLVLALEVLLLWRSTKKEKAKA